MSKRLASLIIRKLEKSWDTRFGIKWGCVSLTREEVGSEAVVSRSLLLLLLLLLVVQLRQPRGKREKGSLTQSAPSIFLQLSTFLPPPLDEKDHFSPTLLLLSPVYPLRRTIRRQAGNTRL
jgi:hypothetical protein